MVNNATALAIYLDPDCIYDLMIEFLHFLLTGVSKDYILFLFLLRPHVKLTLNKYLLSKCMNPHLLPTLQKILPNYPNSHGLPTSPCFSVFGS